MGQGKKITYVRRKREEGEKINGITQTEEREKGKEETFSRTHSKRSKLKNRPRMVSLCGKRFLMIVCTRKSSKFQLFFGKY